MSPSSPYLRFVTKRIPRGHKAWPLQTLHRPLGRSSANVVGLPRVDAAIVASVTVTVRRCHSGWMSIRSEHMAITERSEQNGEAKLTYTDVSRHSSVFFSCSPILEPVDVDLSDLSVFTPKPKRNASHVRAVRSADLHGSGCRELAPVVTSPWGGWDDSATLPNSTPASTRLYRLLVEGLLDPGDLSNHW